MDVKAKEAVSNVESFRKAIQDFLAPELRGISVKLDGIDKRVEELGAAMNGLREEFRSDLAGAKNELRADIGGVRGELQNVEARMKEAIEQAKRELLLTFKLADEEQRNAMLARENAELKQKLPQ